MPSRRTVLIGLGALAATGAAGGAFAWKKFRPLPKRTNGLVEVTRDLRAPADPAAPEFAVASGEIDPAALTEKALAALGSLSRFIRPGEVVLVKPNIGWVRTPAQAANTNPDVVAAVVRAALKAGAKRVIVADSSCDSPEGAYEKSGIAKKASDAGAEVVLPSPALFREVDVKGRQIGLWPLFSPVLDADRVINVPIAKQHRLGTITCALKNWFGIVGGDRHRLHGDIHVSIADLNRFLRPTLTVVDATRVLVRNGPRGGNLDDVEEKNTVIASVDPVAADAYACTLLGAKAADVLHLMTAQSEGLGTADWTKLRTRGI
jgi:uncharacterized protein (DUF362 family)